MIQPVPLVTSSLLIGGGRLRGAGLVPSHKEHDTEVSCQPGALVTDSTNLLLPSADVTKRCQVSASTGALNTMCDASDVQHSEKGTGSPKVVTYPSAFGPNVGTADTCLRCVPSASITCTVVVH